jgi:shikimate dehydrogenase
MTIRRKVVDLTVQRKEDYEDIYLIGLVGWPAEPLPSPQMYDAVLKALGLDWRCVPLPVHGDQLHEALLGLRALGFVGAELAVPYGREALDYIQVLSPAAEMIGSAKFIEVDVQGRLVGDNLYWLGFLDALRAVIAEVPGGPRLADLRPLVIGSGYAARSVVYALTRERLPVTILDAHVDRAIDMVHCLRHVLGEHSFSIYRWPHDLPQVAAEANLIINATTLGTGPHTGRSPWPDDLPFPKEALVFDLISWPNKTPFLRQARASGARTVSGLSLRVHEMALALERWTGHPRPIEVIWQVVGETLLSRPLELDRALPKSSIC